MLRNLIGLADLGDVLVHNTPFSKTAGQHQHLNLGEI